MREMWTCRRTFIAVCALATMYFRPEVATHAAALGVAVAAANAYNKGQTK